MSSPSPYGPLWLDSRQVRFRLWAPTAPGGVALSLRGGAPEPMEAVGDGWYHLDREAYAGDRYAFVIGAGNGSDTLRVPDPASRRQAKGVHGESLLEPPASAYRWQHDDWRGRQWHETVLYEVHAGLHGGYAGIQQRLPALAGLGITAIELMPIAEAPGERNWGYDGTLHFAPHSAYGTPDELRAMIDAAHGLGMMVFLDVVYNHFGPDGNYLHAYAKSFFRSDIQTPWGDAIDFREPSVRAFFTGNAVYWLNEFRFDGLRFDAVHAISEADWLDEMAAIVRRETGSVTAHGGTPLAAQPPGEAPATRHVHLVLEHDGNVASHLRGDFDAQWNDDSHHLLHVLLTDEYDGYYADYREGLAERFARWLSSGFIYQGETSAHRGEPRGEPSTDLSPLAFVNFLQNHDQIGNRPLGDRLRTLCRDDGLRAATALLMLCPQVPLIFDGEQWGSRKPFLYFTDHHDELAEAVRQGRREEFGMFAARAEIPDPNAAATFEASRPSRDDEDDAEQWEAFYRELIALRHSRLVPHLAGTMAAGAQPLGERGVRASWQLGDGRLLTILCNLGTDAIDVPVPPSGERLYAYPAAAGEALSAGRLPAESTIVVIAPPGLAD